MWESQLLSIQDNAVYLCFQALIFDELYAGSGEEDGQTLDKHKGALGSLYEFCNKIFFLIVVLFFQ